MGMLAKGRNDSVYNEDFLDKDGKTFLKGFDDGVECLTNLLHNLDVYEPELNNVLEEGEEPVEGILYAKTPELYKILNDNIELLKFIFRHWSEAERDINITDLIDSMDDDKYLKIRNKVLRKNAKLKTPKEYYDTRHYLTTGEKVCAQIEER